MLADPGNLDAGGGGMSAFLRIAAWMIAVALVVPTTSKPERSNIGLVPTNAMVRSIRPGGSTGCDSTAGAPWAAA